MSARDWLQLADRDPQVGKVLRLLGARTFDWREQYVVFEIVEADVGRRMYDEGWVSRTDANLFTWTANSPDAIGDSARHGFQRNDPPPNPMSAHDATRMIKQLATRWLDAKLS